MEQDKDIQKAIEQARIRCAQEQEEWDNMTQDERDYYTAQRIRRCLSANSLDWPEELVKWPKDDPM